MKLILEGNKIKIDTNIWIWKKLKLSQLSANSLEVILKLPTQSESQILLFLC